MPMFEPMNVPTVPVKARKSSQRQRQHQLKKRTVKFLSVCRDPKVVSSVLRSSPDSVIKTICNAALNVQRGGRVSLGSSEKGEGTFSKSRWAYSETCVQKPNDITETKDSFSTWRRILDSCTD